MSAQLHKEPHRLVRINSEEREQPLTTPTNNFQVNFGNSTQLMDINRIVIKHVSIPNVLYNIKVAGAGAPADATNNVFSYDNGAPQSITITPGFYSIAQLIAAITADAQAIADGLAIILNQTTYKLEFSSTTPITYLSAASGNSMAGVLGILADSSPAVLAFNAQGFPSLETHPNIYIVSRALSDGSNMVSPTLGSLPVVAVVPVDLPYGFVLQYESNQDELDEVNYISYANGKSIQAVDLSVYDGDGQLIDLAGLDWTITFRAYSVPL